MTGRDHVLHSLMQQENQANWRFGSLRMSSTRL